MWIKVYKNTQHSQVAIFIDCDDSQATGWVKAPCLLMENVNYTLRGLPACNSENNREVTN